MHKINASVAMSQKSQWMSQVWFEELFGFFGTFGDTAQLHSKPLIYC
jgi:hypothetical protein